MAEPLTAPLTARPTARLTDWRPRLEAWLQATGRMPYRPGTHDCILCAGGALGAMTGADPMAGWAGRYTTIEEGLDLARAHGCEDPFAYVVAGLDEVPVAYAQVGDIAALAGIDGRPGLGVVIGDMVATVGLRGREYAPLTAALRAWRV